MKIRGKNQGSSRNGFIIALLCSVALAFLFPSPGAKAGWMHPELMNNAGVALILFVQGLATAVERMKAGASNWRLHLNLGLILMPILFITRFSCSFAGCLPVVSPTRTATSR